MKKITAIFIFLAAALLFGVFANFPKSVGAEAVCPNTGDGWFKVDGLSGYSYTYAPIPAGYQVTDNCYKHATYIHYGTGPTVIADSHNECNPSGQCNDITHELSHASFKLVLIGASPTPTPSPIPSQSPSPNPSPTPSPSSSPCLSPTPSPTFTPIESSTPTPSSTPIESGRPTPTPEATLTPTPTTATSPYCGEGEHLDLSGTKCIRFSDPGVESSVGGTQVTGQVLGASSMAGTGVAQDNLFAMIFAIGSVLASFGIRKFSTIKVK